MKYRDLKYRDFDVSDLNIEPGTKTRGILTVNSCPFHMPVTVINGTKPGPTLLVTAGLHNMEFVGINAAIDLANEVEPEYIAGKLIIISLINTDGFEHRTMSVTYADGKNLNRVFPGDPNGTESERFAAWFVKYIYPRIDYIVDLHSGDNYERLESLVFFQGAHSKEVMAESFRIANAVNTPYLIRSHVAHGGLYSEAGNYGVPGIILERGCLSRWTWEEVQQDKDDVKNIMATIGMLPEIKPIKRHHKPVFTHVSYAVAPHTGCWYPVRHIGDYVMRGEIVGEIRNYFGDLICVCTSDVDGIIFIETDALNILEGQDLMSVGCIHFENHHEEISDYLSEGYKHVHELIDTGEEFDV